jgi:hypothetical protein
MRARSVFAGFVAVIVGSLGLVAATAEPAAAVSCPLGPLLLLLGWDTENYNGPQPGETRGSSSYIYTRATDVFCASNDQTHNNSLAWDNVTSADRTDWAQAGTYALPSKGCPEAWAEQALDNGNSLLVKWWYPGGTYAGSTCLSLGSRHAYRNLMVKQSDGTYRVVDSYDGISLLTSSFNPLATVQNGGWSKPLGIQFVEEVHFADTTVPGNFSSPTNYTAMGVQLSDNSLVTTCGHANLARDWNTSLATSFIDTRANSCSAIDIWAK